MSIPRSHTPNKALVLATVAAYPGLSANKIADIAGLLPCATRRILEELQGKRLVCHLPKVQGKRQGRLWYIRAKNGNSEEIKFPVT